MKTVTLSLVFSFLAFAAWAEEAPALKTDKEKISYSIGMNIANGLKIQGIDVDVEALIRGIKDRSSGGKTLLTDAEAQTLLRGFQQQMRAEAEAKQKLLAEENKKKGEAFLEENKTKEGVKVLSSGLQYKILKEGTGPKPKATDTVEVHYKGTLIDGTEFDSSYSRNQTATFPVNGVIKGWTEALQLMPVGSKFQLFIPPGLAYGERQVGDKIGPNSVLIFEVELLGIKTEEKSPKEEKEPEE